MGRNLLTFGIAACAATGLAVLAAPSAHAVDAWVAVANSPNREQQDWAYGPDPDTAAANALVQCTRLERADDCRILAVSADCIATAWDVSEPLNRIYAAVGPGPDAAARAATAAAGPYANDVQVQCAASTGVSLAARRVI
ncbi:MAG TPA: hypothetical protein PLH92_07795 [Mycobacterium sp.]|nr:hypothetical protein [Mycobacterium sp.]HQC76607.1 hypothetical protein [Mycobacterium sp.]